MNGPIGLIVPRPPLRASTVGASFCFDYCSSARPRTISSHFVRTIKTAIIAFMKNLKEKSGLDFSLGEDEVIYEKTDFGTSVDWSKSTEAGAYAYADDKTDLETLYFGVRYMENNEDKEAFIDNDFMADLTVIKPGKVGEEFIKTVGHYHQYVPGTQIAYPEAYEAVSGKFEYLLQSEPDGDGNVDVIWVVTEPGDKVVMPPNYGHVSMNVGEEPAIEVDIQKRDNPNGSDYSIFKERAGGALYRTEKGLIENSKYKIKSVRIVKPLERPDWGLTRNKPLYTSMIEAPEKFRWLTKPQDYDFNLDALFEDVAL